MNIKVTAKNLNIILVGLVVLALFAVVAGAYGANMLLKAKAESVHDARLETMVLERQQQQLAKAKADIEKYRELSEIARYIVPQDKDQAQTVREIVEIAARHNIGLSSISFPSSTLGSKNATNSQLTPVKEIPGVYSMEITIVSDGSQPALFSDFLAFLESLERNRRTALVERVSLQPASGDSGRTSFTLTLTEYIKP